MRAQESFLKSLEKGDPTACMLRMYLRLQKISPRFTGVWSWKAAKILFWQGRYAGRYTKVAF
jgi:hypothetical protein